MTFSEKRATFSIASLFGLRMLGLFMILPVFTVYAKTLEGVTPFLIGLTLSIYGLSQALLQLPFGALSDHYSRKRIIALGFGIFILGSFICAISHNIYGILTGRAIQGAGAVGSTLTALLSDLTRPEKRAKSMALLGMTIGTAFFLALLLGPLLNEWIGVRGIFSLSVFLGIIAIFLLYTAVPVELKTAHTPPGNFIKNVKLLLNNFQLLSLDIGIFCLHAILTASFIVIPLWNLKPTSYLLPLLIGFLLTFIFIGIAEATKKVFISYFLAIIGLVIAEFCLWDFHWGLTLFFLSFNLLEANLPSLISRLSPPAIKGTAMGIFSTCQFLGIFFGGLLGGIIYQYFSPAAVLLSCALLGLFWLIISLIIRFSRRTLWQEV